MVTALVAIAVLALVLALVVAVARDPGPPPADVARAYEEAWDRLDFEALWDLAGEELRDRLHRREYVQAKRAAYAGQRGLGDLASEIAIEKVDVHDAIASVTTRIDLREGGAAHNVITLTKRAGRWVVVGYELQPT
jgi:hypothetical protein